MESEEEAMRCRSCGHNHNGICTVPTFQPRIGLTSTTQPCGCHSARIYPTVKEERELREFRERYPDA